MNGSTRGRHGPPDGHVHVRQSPRFAARAERWAARRRSTYFTFGGERRDLREAVRDEDLVEHRSRRSTSNSSWTFLPSRFREPRRGAAAALDRLAARDGLGVELAAVELDPDGVAIDHARDERRSPVRAGWPRHVSSVGGDAEQPTTRIAANARAPAIERWLVRRDVLSRSSLGDGPRRRGPPASGRSAWHRPTPEAHRCGARAVPPAGRSARPPRFAPWKTTCAP